MVCECNQIHEPTFEPCSGLLNNLRQSRVVARQVTKRYTNRNLGRLSYEFEKFDTSLFCTSPVDSDKSSRLPTAIQPVLLPRYASQDRYQSSMARSLGVCSSPSATAVAPRSPIALQLPAIIPAESQILVPSVPVGSENISRSRGIRDMITPSLSAKRGVEAGPMRRE
jgi:hypothetical protein